MANPHYSECEDGWEHPASQQDRDYLQRIRNRRVSIGELLTSAAVVFILLLTLFSGPSVPARSDITGSISNAQAEPAADMCTEDGYRDHPC